MTYNIHTISLFFVCPKVLGQDFLSSSVSGRLTCSLRSLTSQPEDRLHWTVEARPLSDKLTECLLDRPLDGPDRSAAKTSLPVILEVRVTNVDQLFSNEVFLTLYNGSCATCPDGRMPQHPTVCPARTDVCTLEGSDGNDPSATGNTKSEGDNNGHHNQCFAAGSAHPHEPCLRCTQEGQWGRVKEDDSWAEEHVFSVHQVSLYALQGERLVYSLPLARRSAATQDRRHRLALRKAPGQMRLTADGRLEWVAEPTLPKSRGHGDTADEEVVVVVVEAGRGNECWKLEELILRITVEPCRCANGGTCVRMAAASIAASYEDDDTPSEGQAGCECPVGFSGRVWMLVYDQSCNYREAAPENKKIRS